MQFTEAKQSFLAGYFATCRRSAKTQSAYQIDLAQLAGFLGPDKSLDAIEPETLEAWAQHLQCEHYAAVSIRRKFATTRVFFAYWVRRKAISKSPLWEIRLDLGRERLLPRSLTGADAKRLIEETWREADTPESPITGPRDDRFLKLRNAAAVEVLFATGMRVGESVKLKVQDWSDDDASFVVNGKGSRQRMAFLPDSRSLKALRSYLSHRNSMSCGNDALFVNAAGNQISTQGVARIIGTIAKRANISVRVTPHMIRHTVATLLLEYGTDIRVVQEVLGHASIATTQRYTHVSKAHMRATLKDRHPSHHLNIDVTGAGQKSV